MALKWLHPMRTTRYLFSEKFRPWMKAVETAAPGVGEHRQLVDAGNPLLARCRPRWRPGRSARRRSAGSVRRGLGRARRHRASTLAASAFLGIWLMFCRLVFGTVPPLADSDHLVGALIVTVPVMAMAEVARPLRFINVAFSLWLIAAPWLMARADGRLAVWAGMLAGVAVILLSWPRGVRRYIV